jgi:hypothetical protein
MTSQHQVAMQKAVQAEIERESNVLALEYFKEIGGRSAPLDIGFRAEAILKDSKEGVAEIERILVTAFVPENYPDGLVVDFRSTFRKHFESQGYAVVFGPGHQGNSSGPVFDLRVRRTAISGEGATSNTLAEVKAVVSPYVAQVVAPLRALGKTEMKMIAGAGALISLVLLCMVALAPLRILRRRQQAKQRYRKYPAQASIASRSFRAALPPAGDPPLFKSPYREVPESGIDPEVERIRATMAQMGIKEVLEVLRNLEPRYRDEVLRGLNVHKAIKSRIEKALGAVD